jgi:hypothetical protein
LQAVHRRLRFSVFFSIPCSLSYSREHVGIVFVIAGHAFNAYNSFIQEYFDFESGAARARGIQPETAAKIKQWLKDNQ